MEAKGSSNHMHMFSVTAEIFGEQYPGLSLREKLLADM